MNFHSQAVATSSGELNKLKSEVHEHKKAFRDKLLVSSHTPRAPQSAQTAKNKCVQLSPEAIMRP